MSFEFSFNNTLFLYAMTLFSALTTLTMIYFLFFRDKTNKEQKLPKVDVIHPSPAPKETIEFKDRLRSGLQKSRSSIWSRVKNLINGTSLTNEDKEELESILFQADISTSMVEKILVEVGKRGQGTNPIEDVKIIMKEVFIKHSPVLGTTKQLDQAWGEVDSAKLNKELQVIMVVGVNGVGKTTTVGKIAANLSKNGFKVVVAAADTFRAAAKEQLKIWCDRAGATLVAGAENNNDPAAVCYQALKQAIESKADYCILDTAGRLHNNDQLMEELKKIKRVIGKLLPEAPHETLLVLDAMTGQNALNQASQFQQALGQLTGVILTKCDGSAKAGCALSIVERLKVPIRFIGVGESLEDLNVFKSDEFVDALFDDH